MNSNNFHTRPVVSSEVINPNLDAAPAKKQKPSRLRKFIRIFLLITFIALISAGGYAAYRATSLSSKIFVGEQSDLYHKITGLIAGQTGHAKLAGEENGQINILLLGIGGPGHDGPYLSDTIMLAQIRPKEKKASITAIPRDYLVNTKELGQRKINAVFAESYAKHKDWNQAGKSIREVVSKMSGLEIPYFAVVDFKGFEKTIDLLGGVDVDIERTFTDYTFPDNKFGYLPAVTFKQGREHMNGKRALIFARSRHAAGPEGTDFARSLRQQKIMQAAKTKVVELNLVTDIGKINELLSVVGDHFHTNISPGEMIRLYTLTKDYSGDNIVSISLDPATNLICDDKLESNGAYVLVLCTGKTAQDIQNFFQNSFSTGALVTERAVVWLADSTVTGKLYKKAEAELKNAGITVQKVIYSGKPLTQSVVYSVNHKPTTIDFIKQNLQASPVSLPPPGIKIDKTKVDVIIILGSNDGSVNGSSTSTASPSRTPTPSPTRRPLNSPTPTPTPARSYSPNTGTPSGVNADLNTNTSR